MNRGFRLRRYDEAPNGDSSNTLMDQRWMEIALKMARHGCHSTQKMAAVVVRGGSCLSKAYNLGRFTVWGCINRGRHAEIRALTPYRDFTGSILYIARLNRGNSRPCSDCMEKIKQAGIIRIVYFDASGRIIREKI